MLVRVSTLRVEDPRVPRPWSGGDPEVLTPGCQYYVHAIAVDAYGEASVCVREPRAHPIFPYFYNTRFLTIVDRRIPEWYEFIVQEHDDLHRVLIAPPFWVHDWTFYEQLSNAHINEMGGVVAVFREHIERVRRSLSDDSILV